MLSLPSQILQMLLLLKSLSLRILLMVSKREKVVIHKMKPRNFRGGLTIQTCNKKVRIGLYIGEYTSNFRKYLIMVQALYSEVEKSGLECRGYSFTTTFIFFPLSLS